RGDQISHRLARHGNVARPNLRDAHGGSLSRLNPDAARYGRLAGDAICFGASTGKSVRQNAVTAHHFEGVWHARLRASGRRNTRRGAFPCSYTILGLSRLSIPHIAENEFRSAGVSDSGAIRSALVPPGESPPHANGWRRALASPLCLRPR